MKNWSDILNLAQSSGEKCNYNSTCHMSALCHFNRNQMRWQLTLTCDMTDVITAEVLLFSTRSRGTWRWQMSWQSNKTNNRKTVQRISLSSIDIWKWFLLFIHFFYCNYAHNIKSIGNVTKTVAKLPNAIIIIWNYRLMLKSIKIIENTF